LQFFSKLPEGDLPAEDAMAYAREAQRVANAVVQLDPEDQTSSYALWDSCKNLVDIQVRMGDPGHALDDGVCMLNTAQELANRSPGDARALKTLLLSHEENAKLKLSTGSKVGGFDHYGFAVETARKRAEIDPDGEEAQADLWRVLTDLGDAQQKARQSDEALKSEASARDVALLNLAKPGFEKVWLDRAGFSFVRLADLHGERRESSEALDACAQAVAFGRRFLDRTPEADGWSYNLWFALSQWGKALSDVARFPEALNRQEEALRMAESASSREVGREEAMSAMWFSLRELAETMIKMGELRKGLEKHHKALHIAERQKQLDASSALWRSYELTSIEEVKELEKLVR
jgi:tetratricopeptide (TPR) repeat protein